ncbi:MAG: 50S ribosomal protein L18 [Desulfobacterales bacterium]|nr:50S ribosomal protein L18 [Desulfobacterales bacterium]
MGTLNAKTKARLKRKKRIRKKIQGGPAKPRLCVFRSARHIYAQVIDDIAGATIASASSVEKTYEADPEKKGKIEQAVRIGRIVGERAVEKGVKKVVFDRNGFLYHGRVKALSEGARKAGLDF